MGPIQHIGPRADHSHRRDIRTAILMVEMLAHGPLDVDDPHVANTVKLMAFQVARLHPGRQTMLLNYAARKLAAHPDAEPLLVAGYEGMVQRDVTIPAPVKIRLTEALERLVNLYEARKAEGDAAKAAKYRKLLEASTH